MIIMLAKTRTLLLLAAASIMFAGVAAGAQDQSTPAAKARQAMIGKEAPELKVNQWINTDGQTPSLKDLRGKVVVLDFFAFW